VKPTYAGMSGASVGIPFLAGVLLLGLAACGAEDAASAEEKNHLVPEDSAEALADQPAPASAGGNLVWPRELEGVEPASAERRYGEGPTAGTQHASLDPAFAALNGWPVTMPAGTAGAILPANRIVCYYGNPNSTRMGALGRYPKDEMLAKLRREVNAWTQASPETPAKPCLHMVAVVAQGDAGTSGHYRSIMRDSDVQKVYDWAREVDGIFIVDIQVGTDDIRNILPRFEWILKHPDVHLGIDPEFMMKDGSRPGSRIGTMDAADINYASEYLANLVREHNLPPKTFVVHRFTQRMVTNYQNIQLRPEVQIVMHMDGWGQPWLKRDTYRDYVVREPVQFTGFKLFYDHDTRKGDALMGPADILKLNPAPIYIQYQ
jgi:hypothetical protein